MSAVFRYFFTGLAALLLGIAAGRKDGTKQTSVENESIPAQDVAGTQQNLNHPSAPSAQVAFSDTPCINRGPIRFEELKKINFAELTIMYRTLEDEWDQKNVKGRFVEGRVDEKQSAASFAKLMPYMIEAAMWQAAAQIKVDGVDINIIAVISFLDSKNYTEDARDSGDFDYQALRQKSDLLVDNHLFYEINGKWDYFSGVRSTDWALTRDGREYAGYTVRMLFSEDKILPSLVSYFAFPMPFERGLPFEYLLSKNNQWVSDQVLTWKIMSAQELKDLREKVRSQSKSAEESEAK